MNKSILKVITRGNITYFTNYIQPLNNCSIKFITIEGVSVVIGLDGLLSINPANLQIT